MNHEKDAQCYARVRKLAAVPVAAALIGLTAGCVPQDRYDDLLTSYRTLQEQNVQLDSEVDSMRSTNDLYQTRVGRSASQLTQLDIENNRLRSDLDQVNSDYEALLAQIDSMELGPLPDDVTLALEQLAAKYPSMLTFDARLGMVQFASDLTFALGSAELTPAAVASITEFAKIANSQSISGYELKLVGHTDSVPIRNTATRAKHPTNTHLSVHRSISVGEALREGGIAPERIQVAGYGQYRPVVQNGTAGAPENRRVEVFLMPMKTARIDLPESSGANAAAATREKTVEVEEPMK